MFVRREVLLEVNLWENENKEEKENQQKKKKKKEKKKKTGKLLLKFYT